MLSGQTMNINGSSASCTGNSATSTTSTRLSDATNGLRIANPGGGSYATGASTATGAIKIKLPTASFKSNTMLRFTVKIYQYAGGASGLSRTIEIGGYNYSDAAANWINYFVYQNTMGGGELNVRFGNDGTSQCVWIGELATVWDYPQVTVTDFQGGYSNYTDAIWATGWGITFATAFDTVTQGPIVAAKPINSQNYSSYALPLSGGTVSGVVRINNQLQVGQNTNGTAYIDAYGGYAWFGKDSNSTGIRIDGSANVHMTAALNVVGAITQNSNQVLHAGNYNSYSPTLTGTGASGSWGISITGSSASCTGNAATCTTANGIADGTVSTSAKIAASVVTYAKIQNVSVSTVLGNSSASVAQAPVEISMASLAGMLSGQTMNINGSSASCTGNAATATNGFTVKPGWAGNQNLIAATSNFNNSVPSGFYEGFQATNSPTATWYNLINVRHSNTGNDHGFQLAMSYYDEVLWSRSYQGGTGANNGTFTTWRAHLHSGNYNSYAPTLTGGGASGSWGISITGSSASCTGNAATCTTANGIADGTVSTSAKIAASVVTYAKIQNVSISTVLGNSSASVAQAPVEIGMSTLAGMLSGQTMNINGSSASCTGNAASATLATKASTLSQGGGTGSAMTFNWSGQSGQPSWLWGGNDGVNHYVYNPANFDVSSSRRLGLYDGTSYNSGSNSIASSGGRGVSLAPNTYVRQISFEFKNGTFTTIAGNYGGLLTIAPYDGTTASTGDSNYQLFFSSAAANSTSAPVLRVRAGIDTTWGSWATLIHDSNFSTAIPNSGVTAGTYNNVTVNAKGIVTGGSNVSYLTGNQTITLGGDLSGSGTTSITATIANNAVTNAKLNTMGAGTIKGNNGGVANTPSDLTAAQVATMLSGQSMNISGSSTSCSGNAATCTTANGIADGTVSTTAKLANSVVTYAKIQNVGASSVLGNTSASVSQAPQEITFTNLGPYINGVARAWVTFNENPSTGAITINASLGISSVTRINYGQYRVNFSTAFADANYAVSGTIGYESNGGYLYGGFLNIPRVATPKTTTYCEVTASYGDGNTYNARFVHVVFDR
jgi:hypothetical protein